MSSIDKKRLIRILTILVVLLGSYWLLTFRLWGLPVSGRVLDEADGKPLEGAIVVASWMGSVSSSWADSHASCYHVMTATTDKDGEFRTPFWLKDSHENWHDSINWGSTRTNVFAYKSSYRTSMDDRGYIHEENGDHYLIKDDRSREERLEHLNRVIRSAGCHGAGKSLRNQFSFEKAIYEEAKSLAITKKDKKMLQWLREVVAGKALAEDGSVSQKEHDRKVEEYLKDHLQ